MPESNFKPIVAAFDFDGTITTRDSLLPFLIYSSGIFRSLWNFILCTPFLIGFFMGILPRGKAKEQFIRKFFRSLPLSSLHRTGESFAKGYLPKLVKQEALSRIKWHLKQGHQCILISASLDVYLTPWAKEVGFHHVICSQLETDQEGKITGNLEKGNCWGIEKVTRLAELIGPLDKHCIYAYGDSRGDKELLDAATYPFFKQMPS